MPYCYEKRIQSAVTPAHERSGAQLPIYVCYLLSHSFEKILAKSVQYFVTPNYKRMIPLELLLKTIHSSITLFQHLDRSYENNAMADIALFS